MRINHNVMASNANRYLSATGSRQAKSLEKISSGLRINTAADDAAGLAISEKMRAQVTGLEQAADNALDGISLIQTAEGALNETHSILQRMRELAVQSSNDTNTDSERVELQKEVDELAKELTRIANNTEFNSKKISNGALTSGNMGEVKFHIGANAGQDISLSLAAMDAKSLNVSRDVATATVGAGAVDVTNATLSGTLGTSLTTGATVNLTASGPAAASWAAADMGLTGGGALQTTTNSSAYNGYTVTVTVGGAGSNAVSVDAGAQTIAITVDETSGTNIADLNALLGTHGLEFAGGATQITASTATSASGTVGVGDSEIALTIGSETQVVSNTATSAIFTSAENQGLTVELDGAVTAGANAAITIGMDTASEATFAAGELTAEATTSAGIDISTQTAGSSAITTIDSAITVVSAERSKLGAYQNRLEHTINNLNTTSENLQASESRIRDVDIAKEMMNYTKLNILQQAAQSMLAQANQAPQGVLQLLR